MGNFVNVEPIKDNKDEREKVKNSFPMMEG